MLMAIMVMPIVMAMTQNKNIFIKPYCEHSSGRDMPARFANTCWNMRETDTRRGIVAGKLERGFIRKERHCRRGNISVTEKRLPVPCGVNAQTLHRNLRESKGWQL